MKFDLCKLKKYYESGNMKEMKSLAYTYCSNVTYLREEDYDELILMIDTIIDIIYDIKEREVQEAFFDVVRSAVNINFGKCDKLCKSIDKIVKKIESNNINSWELAESLLVISSTMDKRYSDIMKCYIESDDNYVQDVVKEYFLDTID